MDRTVKNNFIFAFVAQVISLLSSLAVTFFVSSLIGVKQFGYWQLFFTYVSYVSMTRIGINDGLYLRLGGIDYADLDYDLLSSERQYFNLYQLGISLAVIFAIINSSVEPDRKFVLMACAICIFIVNSNGYLIYILQAVNKTSVYSISVILQNITWFIAVAIIMLFKIYSYKVLVVMYVLGHVLAGVYLRYNAKELVKFRKKDAKLVFYDIKENIRCGIKLMISTYAGSLIISSCKMIVDYAWGLEAFSVFSFALTLANVFMTFIRQTSIVVFPALRRVDKDHIVEVYSNFRNGLSLILPLSMMGYLPIVFIVNAFLPQYVSSLAYVPIFLPICTFDGKMQMMCSSFFKSMRKEKELLIINLVTLFGSICIACIGALFVKKILFVALGILLIVSLRSIASELLLAKWMHVSIRKDLVQEILLVVFFVVGSFVCSPVALCCAYGIAYMVYLLLNMKNVKKLGSLRGKKS